MILVIRWRRIEYLSRSWQNYYTWIFESHNQYLGCFYSPQLYEKKSHAAERNNRCLWSVFEFLPFVSRSRHHKNVGKSLLYELFTFVTILMFVFGRLSCGLLIVLALAWLTGQIFRWLSKAYGPVRPEGVVGPSAMHDSPTVLCHLGPYTTLHRIPDSLCGYL